MPLEAMIWVAGLTAVALPDPRVETDWTLCIFDWTGFFEWLGLTCPGCGLGHAVGYLFRGEFAMAFETHWLVGGMVICIVGRVMTLLMPLVNTGWHLAASR